MTAPMSPSDDDLLRLISAGDEEAFIGLYRRRQGGIYRFALHMSGSATIAEEVTQEVFLALIRDANNFDPTKGSLSAYLFGIARNQVSRFVERDRSHVPISDDSEEENVDFPETLITRNDPLGDLTRSEKIESVRQAVFSLPVHYREVVVLCDLQEMTYIEVARALGCAVGTIRSRLHRAHALLIEKLRSVEVFETASKGASSARDFT